MLNEIFEILIETLAPLNLKEFEEFVKKEVQLYLETKKKLIGFGISEQHFYEAMNKVKDPVFLKLAKTLEEGKLHPYSRFVFIFSVKNYSWLILVTIKPFSICLELLRSPEFQRFASLPKLKDKNFEEVIEALASLTRMGWDAFFKKEIATGMMIY